MYERDNKSETRPTFDYYEEYESAGMIFFSRCIPVLTIGMILWMFSTLAFGGVIAAPFVITGGVFIGAVVGYFIGWIATFILAYKRENTAAMIVFFVTSFATGIIEAPIIVWATGMLGSATRATDLFFIASIMGVLATAGALIVGRRLGRRITEGLFRGAFIMLIILIPVELILYWVIGFNLTIFLTSIIMFGLIFITILYDGAHLKESIEHSWMLPVLSIFLDLVIMIIRLFIIIVSVVARDN